MRTYKNKGYTIEIELPKNCGYQNYSVECTYQYNKDKNKYSLSMWLKRTDIPLRHAVISKEIDTQFISGTKETVKKNICRIVEQALLSGFFSPYIEDYEYICACFDEGNALFEKRRFETENRILDGQKKREVSLCQTDTH